MDIETIRTVLLWCTLLNVAILAAAWIMTALAGGWVYRMHSRFYPISREAFYVTIYAFLGLYKMLVFVFNLVPYIALRIVSWQ